MRFNTVRNILVILIVLSGFLSVRGQLITKKEVGIPFITNYTPQIYKAYSQNWSIVQDKKGIIYVANGRGVLEFDGVQWNLINVNNYLPVFALAIDSNNTIWVGTALDFGYLLPDAKGKMYFQSISNAIEYKDRKFSVKGKIYTTRQGVFYKTDNRLFRHYKGRISVYALTEPSNCFIFNDNFYVWQKGIGLQMFDNDILRLVRDGEKFAHREILFMLPFKDKSGFFVINHEGVYHFDKVSTPSNYTTINCRKIRSQIDQFINKDWLLDAIRLKNGNYAIGTLRDGTFVIDTLGAIVQHINKESGVFNNTHISLKESDMGSLWIAMDNGIARAEISSPITFWNDAYGLKGSVAAVTRFKGRIFAGTYQGLYYMQSATYDSTKQYSNEILLHDFQFLPVDPIYIQVWDMTILKDNKGNDVKLIVATSGGIYEIDDIKAKLIADGKYFKLFRSRHNPDLLYAGMNNGIAVFNVSEEGKKISYQSNIPGISDKIVSIEEDDNGRIWMGARYGGIICLNKTTGKHLSSTQNHYEIIKFDTTDGLPETEDILIYRVFGKLYFLSEDGNYTFEENTKPSETLSGKFVKNYDLTNGFKFKNYFIYTLATDNNNCLWMQAISKKLKDNIIAYAHSNKNNGKGKNQFEFLTAPFRTIPFTSVFQIYPEANGRTWFAADDGLFLYNANVQFNYKKKYYTLIRKIVIGKDSVFSESPLRIIKDSTFFGIPITTYEKQEIAPPVISYDYNSILFEYSAPTFFNEKYNLYSYYLEGFDDKWSDWTRETRKEYTNLPAGKYVFRVVAKNIYDTISEEASFEFTIQTPWYQTFWAFLLYLLMLIIIIYTIVWYSGIRQKKINERLATLVHIRTKELDDKNKSLIKERENSEKLLLNILPKATAEELKTIGLAKTMNYEFSTVMFADFKSFTNIAEKLSPQELIHQLNKFFVGFDLLLPGKSDSTVSENSYTSSNQKRKIFDRLNNVEKIKTIGDAYMCVGGIPEANKTNPIDVVLFALHVLEFVEQMNQKQPPEKPKWEIRIGIHTGPVITGVVGTKKYTYDVWGDTVNVAARMESASEVSKINISGCTYELIKNYFKCTYRGNIPAKNKGLVEMYYVERLLEEYSEDEHGLYPNEKFWEMYNKIQKNNV